MNTIQKILFIALALGLGASQAFAQISVSASASADTSGATADADADADADTKSDENDFDAPWGTEAGTGELGLYWGLFFPSGKHELYDAGNAPFHKLEKVTPDLGLRAAYFPARVLGVELEGGILPSQTRDTNANLNIFALRGHAMLLAPTEGIVPFLLAGGGVLAMSSDPTVMGSDMDGVIHVGVGAKAYALRNLAIRIDVRDNITMGRGADQMAQHWEALLGFSVVLGRTPLPPPPPPDADGDGFDDTVDKCKDQPGIAPDGCPPPPDADADTILDAVDACPTVAGPANTDPTKNGCPPPPDGDGDGVPDPSDKCPDVVGDGADGCIADTDGDGIRDRDDRCAKEPETKNGFEDADGCADELPEVVKKFTGVIEGIVFDANKATIRPQSFAKLDEAAKVLTDYPELRMQVSGHTDTSGKAERNIALSTERAESVKTYMVSKGVAAERIETLGAGPSTPIADNTTKEGRAKNRRIEFKLLQ